MLNEEQQLHQDLRNAEATCKRLKSEAHDRFNRSLDHKWSRDINAIQNRLEHSRLFGDS